MIVTSGFHFATPQNVENVQRAELQNLSNAELRIGGYTNLSFGQQNWNYFISLNNNGREIRINGWHNGRLKNSFPPQIVASLIQEKFCHKKGLPLIKESAQKQLIDENGKNFCFRIVIQRWKVSFRRESLIRVSPFLWQKFCVRKITCETARSNT